MGLCGCATVVFALQREKLGCVKRLQNFRKICPFQLAKFCNFRFFFAKKKTKKKNAEENHHFDYEWATTAMLEEMRNVNESVLMEVGTLLCEIKLNRPLAHESSDNPGATGGLGISRPCTGHRRPMHPPPPPPPPKKKTKKKPLNNQNSNQTDGF